MRILQIHPNTIIRPGNGLLMKRAFHSRIKVAIASGSKNCRLVLERLDIISYFDGIADGYSVVNSKPAPDLFVYAAGLVQVPTPDCLGVEDADAGIEAIKTAGMQALGIGPKERFHRADKVLPTLASLHLADVLN